MKALPAQNYNIRNERSWVPHNWELWMRWVVRGSKGMGGKDLWSKLSPTDNLISENRNGNSFATEYAKIKL